MIADQNFNGFKAFLGHFGHHREPADLPAVFLDHKGSECINHRGLVVSARAFSMFIVGPISLTAPIVHLRGCTSWTVQITCTSRQPTISRIDGYADAGASAIQKTIWSFCEDRAILPLGCCDVKHVELAGSVRPGAN